MLMMWKRHEENKQRDGVMMSDGGRLTLVRRYSRFIDLKKSRKFYLKTSLKVSSQSSHFTSKSSSMLSNHA